MQSPFEKFEAAKRATAAAISELVDGTYFTIVAGTEKATAVYPTDGWPTQASAATRAKATREVDGLRPDGGTAMGTWLAHVRGIVRQHPGALTHAILLTDGKDEHETPKQLGKKSRAARANSLATAEEWEPTGRSRSCVLSRLHYWVPWTSSPIPRISRTISQR